MNTPQIILNIASNYVRMAFGIVTTLLLTPLIVSKLGSEALGLWALTNTVAGYFSLTDLGITSATIKYISHYRALQQWDDLNKTISTSMSCFAILSILLLAASFVLSQFAPNFFHIEPSLVATTRALIIIVGMVAAIGFLTVIPMQCAIASQRQDLLNTSLLVVQVIGSVVSLVGVYSGCGIILLGAVQIFTAVCNGIVGVVITRKYLPQARFRVHWHRSHGKLIASFAGFALLMSVASRIIYFTDSVVIGHYLTLVAVAGYSIGLKILEFMRSLVGCGAGVLGTFVSEQSAHGKTESLGAIWTEGTKWALALTLPISLLCLLDGSSLITSWVGTYYPQAGLALGLLSIGLCADLGQSAGCQILINGGKHKPLAILFCFEAATNLSLSLLLIKPFGLLGVAIGTVIPQLIRVLIFTTVLMPQVTGMRLSQHFTKAVVPAYLAASVSMIAVVIYKVCGLHTGKTSLAALGVLMAVTGVMGMYRFCLTSEHRVLILRKLRLTKVPLDPVAGAFPLLVKEKQLVED